MRPIYAGPVPANEVQIQILDIKICAYGVNIINMQKMGDFIFEFQGNDSPFILFIKVISALIPNMRGGIRYTRNIILA